MWNRIRNWFRRRKPAASPKPTPTPIPRPKPEEPERVGPNTPGQNFEFCPFAIRKPEFQMPTRGEYALKYPRGAVVHFTAGSSAESSIEWGKDQGFAFWMIAKDGTIYQNHSLRRWGHHAGKSVWPGLGTSLSDDLVGIEVDCAGRLTRKNNQWVSWFGRVVTSSKVRVSKGEANIKPGAYEMFTPEQEASLKRLLLWLKENNPKVFQLEYVVSHDEIAPDRKDDVGAALSMTMPAYREMLKKEYARGKK